MIFLRFLILQLEFREMAFFFKLFNWDCNRKIFTLVYLRSNEFACLNYFTFVIDSST